MFGNFGFELVCVLCRKIEVAQSSLYRVGLGGFLEKMLLTIRVVGPLQVKAVDILGTSADPSLQRYREIMVYIAGEVMRILLLSQMKRNRVLPITISVLLSKILDVLSHLLPLLQILMMELEMLRKSPQTIALK